MKRLGSSLPACAMAGSLLGCVSSIKSNGPELVKHMVYSVETPTSVFDTPGMTFAPGSGLRWFENKGNTGRFWFVTDRGPNKEAPKSYGDAKVFPLPSFQPMFGILELDESGQKAKVVEAKPFLENGKPLNGLPPPSEVIGAKAEKALDEQGNILEPSSSGIDPESVEVGKDGKLYVGDEYWPAVLQVDPKSGEVSRRFTPGQGLPNAFRHRQLNRGLEGLAISESGTLWAALQSSVPFERDKKKQKEPFIRVARMALTSQETLQEFALPVPPALFPDATTAKVGDVVALGEDNWAVILQGESVRKQFTSYVAFYGKNGGCVPQDLQKLPGFLENRSASPCSPFQFKNAVSLNALGWQHQKSEGLTLWGDRKLVVSNDNDFGVGEEGFEAKSQLLVLEFETLRF